MSRYAGGSSFEVMWERENIPIKRANFMGNNSVDIDRIKAGAELGSCLGFFEENVARQCPVCWYSHSTEKVSQLVKKLKSWGFLVEHKWREGGVQGEFLALNKEVPSFLDEKKINVAIPEAVLTAPCPSALASRLIFNRLFLKLKSVFPDIESTYSRDAVQGGLIWRPVDKALSFGVLAVRKSNPDYGDSIEKAVIKGYKSLSLPEKIICLVPDEETLGVVATALEQHSKNIKAVRYMFDNDLVAGENEDISDFSRRFYRLESDNTLQPVAIKRFCPD